MRALVSSVEGAGSQVRVIGFGGMVVMPREVTFRRVNRFLRRAVRLVRGAMVSARIISAGGSVGRLLEVESGFHFRVPPGPGIHLGSRVYMGYNVILEVFPDAGLRIGDRVKIMHGVIVAAANQISIGADTQIAEYSSIRDSEHGLEIGALVADQTVRGVVDIGDDVWVGRGCAVLPGAVLGSGAVLGANSVLKRTVPPLAIAVGAPARVIRTRGD
ncbi:acyltransferase [Demequina zhanjiangensis]|uniref:acyltransferase n=1 Tax=Demequina zhanjiangensis TaxID=3051659 RepID=UPI00345E4FD2